ncbi:MAG TPA: MBL fold metallo-hydrolase [Planctomycetota bacterium]|nr:MBL fold metallo-hydrolase [Planctomycetota bacterium]
MEIRFRGAAREVTGSCHELLVGGKRVFLDCGMFQGTRREAAEKNLAFRGLARDVDAVVLSHAHVDHCGNLPQLAAADFRGPVYATAATRDLARVMLLDSARIQEADARHLAKRGIKVRPLYGEDEARAALARFRGQPYDRWFDVVPGLRAKFSDAGHILGSASVHLEIREPGRDVLRLTFTGDLGRKGVPLLRDPAPLAPAEIVLTESTYGARSHRQGDKPEEEMKKSLEDAVKKAWTKGGKLIIPAFALGRTQNLLYFLNELREEGRIPQTKIFIDSPLATETTAIVRRYPDLYDAAAREKIARAVEPLLDEDVEMLETPAQSKRLNEARGTCVIIAPSGMCEFGRILHHLLHGLDDPRNTVAFVGYQGRHTLGRAILEGRDPVRIYDALVPVRAEILRMNGFSAHADRDELLEALAPLRDAAQHVFVVHGEPEQADALAQTLESRGFSGVVSPAPDAHVAI